MDTSTVASKPDEFCPYVGLERFDDSHADYFFGRRLDSAKLADHIISRSITVLYGGSGVGKSSVLNVGLPRALVELGVKQQSHIYREWSSIPNANAWLSSATTTIRAPFLLVFDQFEEFFLYRDAKDVEEFSNELRPLLRDPDVDVHLLITLRSDALHLLDGMRRHLPQIFNTTVELRHLGSKSVREAVEGPIRVYNERYRIGRSPIELDDHLADYFMDEVNWKSDSDTNTLQPGGRVELPFLQLALKKIVGA